MQKNPIDQLLGQRVSWLADSGPEDDIAISSRIRLARNLKDIPFPTKADSGQLHQVLLAVKLAMEKLQNFSDFFDLSMSDLGSLERQLLLERRLISQEFCLGKKNSSLIVSKDEILGLMINEEDHIRMQAMRPGFQLREVWKLIDDIDDHLAKELPFAFNRDLGFLTSCPTNVGTGMRASVMLHLPGLALAEQINAVMQAINKLGLAVRGIFGEGSESLGNLFQISNQGTLGESEGQIIERLEVVIRQIINHEKNFRQKLLESKRNFLLDCIGRAYGTLCYAYSVSSEETLNSLSTLRLGVDMGMFSSLDIHTVNELFVMVQPAHLQKFAGKELDSAERDIFRATILREKLKPLKNNGLSAKGGPA